MSIPPINLYSINTAVAIALWLALAQLAESTAPEARHAAHDTL
jgi:hypothetical protein